MENVMSQNEPPQLALLLAESLFSMLAFAVMASKNNSHDSVADYSSCVNMAVVPLPSCHACERCARASP